MATITIKGVCVLVDDDDLALVEKHTWYFTKGYAVTALRIGPKVRKTTGMHRLILGNPDSPAIDHINRNKLDNRRCNIRACTDAENNKNRPTVDSKSSVHRGVSKRGDRWQVVVRIAGKITWLGAFANQEEAAKVAAPHFIGIAA